jgi:hypothetical protein
MGLPSGETDGGGGGDKSGLDISFVFQILFSTSGKERGSRGGKED